MGKTKKYVSQADMLQSSGCNFTIIGLYQGCFVVHVQKNFRVTFIFTERLNKLAK